VKRLTTQQNVTSQKGRPVYNFSFTGVRITKLVGIQFICK